MILMRTLRKDYARYNKDEEMDDMVFPLLFIDADSSLNYSGFVFQ